MQRTVDSGIPQIMAQIRPEIASVTERATGNALDVCLGMGGTLMTHSIRHKSMTAAAAIGASALLLVGCATREFGDTRAQAMGNAAAPFHRSSA
jgi:hypothetical protein